MFIPVNKSAILNVLTVTTHNTMKTNEGAIDRILRVVLAVVLFWLAAVVTNVYVAIVVGIVGLVLLFTGVLGYCGLYALLGISTNKKNQSQTPPTQ